MWRALLCSARSREFQCLLLRSCYGQRQGQIQQPWAALLSLCCRALGKGREAS